MLYFIVKSFHMSLFELFFKDGKPIYARGSFLGSIFHFHAVGEILEAQTGGLAANVLT